jgi:flagellar biosynthesis/type III secretory pathway protein FliH
LARLIFDALGAVLPVTCAAVGVAEIMAVARAVLPAMTAEPSIVVRVNPCMAAEVEKALADLEREPEQRLQVLAADAIAPGDVRISWRDGAAVRDAGAAWGQVVEALAPLGLAPTVAAKVNATTLGV